MILCWIIGHKFIYHYGNWSSDRLIWHTSDFCVRCGKSADQPKDTP